MSTTAIILRDPKANPIQVLECDGPRSIPNVHIYPGSYSHVFLGYDEWLSLPKHARETRERSGGRIEFESGERISRLLEFANYKGTLSRRHIEEIQWRLEMIFPGCTGDTLPTPRNLQSA